MKTFAAALLASLVTSTMAQAQGPLWIVDDSGGSDVNFTNLQAAIDAASGGHTLLVRPGFYGNATIDAKSLFVVAEVPGTPPTVNVSVLTVRNLSAAQSTVLRGLRANGFAFEASAGTIWGEELLGTDPILGLFGATPFPALDVQGCAAVVLQRCDLTGGAGPSTIYPGVRSTSSNLYVFDSTIRGFYNPSGGGGGPYGFVGEPGFELIGGSLFVAGGKLRGGQGVPGGPCYPGGPGGPGLELSGASPVARRLETILEGGPGGCAQDWPYCTICGPTGVPSVVLSGTLTTLIGSARHYELGSPASGANPTQVQYQGQPGDFVFGALSLGAQPALALALNGALLVPVPPLLLLVHGQADLLGALALPMGVPTIPPGFSITAYMQAGALATDGMVWLGAGSALTLVH